MKCLTAEWLVSVFCLHPMSAKVTTKIPTQDHCMNDNTLLKRLTLIYYWWQLVFECIMEVTVGSNVFDVLFFCTVLLVLLNILFCLMFCFYLSIWMHFFVLCMCFLKKQTDNHIDKTILATLININWQYNDLLGVTNHDNHQKHAAIIYINNFSCVTADLWSAILVIVYLYLCANFLSCLSHPMQPVNQLFVSCNASF